MGLPSDPEDIAAEQLVEGDINLPSPSEDTGAGGVARAYDLILRAT